MTSYWMSRWMDFGDGIMHYAEWDPPKLTGALGKWRKACGQGGEVETVAHSIGGFVYCKLCFDTPHGVAV
jgi:hypothetical protein